VIISRVIRQVGYVARRQEREEMCEIFWTYNVKDRDQFIYIYIYIYMYVEGKILLRCTLRKEIKDFGPVTLLGIVPIDGLL
jgi:hypothetical protein